MKTVFDPAQVLNIMRAQGNNHAPAYLTPDGQGQRELVRLLTPLYDEYHGFGLNPFARLTAIPSMTSRLKFKLTLESLVEFPEPTDALLLFQNDNAGGDYDWHLLAFEAQAHEMLTACRKPSIHFWKKAHKWAVLDKSMADEHLSYPIVVEA